MRFVAILPFLMFGCSDETISGYADPTAVYELVELNGEPVTSDATVAFLSEGRAEGNGPCNAWSASQTAPYPWIESGPIAATRRACPELALESRLFEALTNVSLAEVSGPVLVLSGDQVEMVFRAK